MVTASVVREPKEPKTYSTTTRLTVSLQNESSSLNCWKLTPA